jgi:hypothetical protein
MKIKFKQERDKFWTCINLTLAGIFFIAMIIAPLYTSDVSFFIIYTFCFLINLGIGITNLYDAIEWDY